MVRLRTRLVGGVRGTICGALPSDCATVEGVLREGMRDCRERPVCRSVPGGKIHFYGECRFIPPHQSLNAPASPQGEAFLTLCEQGK